MSTEAVNWAYKQECPSSGAKFLLVTLCDYADEHGYCYPSQSKLAAQTQQGLRTVVGHLAALEKAGLVKREQRFRKDGGKTSDAYVVQWLPIRENGVSHTQDSRIPPAKMAYPPCENGVSHTQDSRIHNNHQIKPSEYPSERERERVPASGQPPARAAPPRTIGNLIPLPDPFVNDTPEIEAWVREQKMPFPWVNNRTDSFVAHFRESGTMLSPERWQERFKKWLLDDWAKERNSGLLTRR